MEDGAGNYETQGNGRWNRELQVTKAKGIETPGSTEWLPVISDKGIHIACKGLRIFDASVEYCFFEGTKHHSMQINLDPM